MPQRKRSRRNAEKEIVWRETLANHAASGLSVREFCRQHGLREPAFYFWRRTLAQRETNQPTGDAAMQSQPAFVPVKVVAASGPASPAPGGFVLELRSGRALRLPESISVERLAAIVRAIESEVSP